CSTTRVSAVVRPEWWSYPVECAAGHPWAPGRVTVGWMPCDCPNSRANGVLGHLWVRCRADGCSSIWYRPRHQRARLGLALALAAAVGWPWAASAEAAHPRVELAAGLSRSAVVAAGTARRRHLGCRRS